MEKVNIIAKNPMALCSDEDLDQGILATMNKKNKKSKKQMREELKNNEAMILESSLVKIGRLLGLCFGEAGAKIIGENISLDGSGDDFQPLITGVKSLSIFGFCDIRGFEEVNEVLQQNIMTFVNQIAEVVHTNVDKFGGANNKNLGAAFLFIWKFDEDDIDHAAEEPTFIDNTRPSIVAEMAILGYVKCIAKINQYNHILDYSENQKIQKVIPNFKVNMGFGLHVGWAIEGAIGSFFKIDASYLSPNVNIAARLEGATRQYGIPILISGELYDICTDDFKGLMRCIDIVTVKGSNIPMRFMTMNLETDTMKPKEFEQLSLSSDVKKKQRKEKREDINSKVQHLTTPYEILVRDKDFIKMREDKRGNQAEFDETYERAFQQYIDGTWMEAYDTLQECSILNPSDGPTKTLIHFIESNNRQAPDDWEGYRKLTSK